MRNLSRKLAVTTTLTLLLFAFTLHPAPFTSEAYAADEGAAPVAHWRFDEGGGPTAYDEGWTDTDSDGIKDSGESWNNNDALLGNDISARKPTWSLSGKIGGCLNFDGIDDYAYIGLWNDVASLKVTGGDWSYSAWIKTSSDGYVICCTDTDDFVRLEVSGGKAVFFLRWTEYPGPVVHSKSAISTTNVNDGNWHHIAGVWSGDNNYIYVDGVLEGSNSGLNAFGPWAMSTWSGSWVIGAQWDSCCSTSPPGDRTNGKFNGYIDDVRIYDYARIAAQIKQDYNNGMAVRLAAGTDPNEGSPPVAYYTMDRISGSTLYDVSGNGHNGTITGATVAQGKHGMALDFNGSSNKVDCGNITEIGGAGAITVSAWFKADSGFSFPNGRPVVGVGNTTSKGHFYIRAFSDTGWSFSECSGSPSRITIGADDGASDMWHAGASAQGTQTGIWYHVAVSYNPTGNVVKLYVDGELVKTSALSQALNLNQKLQIGTDDYSTQWFDGLIDEVRVYDYVRTPAQVAYDYNKGKPVAHYKFDEGTGTIAHNDYSSADSGAAPIGWWRMDEGTGGTTADASGNGHTGTLYPQSTGTNTTTAQMWDQTGKIGPDALEFDGTDDYVSISYDNPVNATSVVAWFKRLGVPAGGYHIITGSANVEISIEEAGDFIRTGVVTDTQGRQVFNSGSGLVDGAWHQVAMTYDGTTLRSYIDGRQTAANSVSGSLSGTASEIGRYGSNSYVANGLIDDVKIYGYARTQEQIYNDYKSTHGTMVDDTKFVDGKLGKALSFDGGNDCVIVPDDLSLKPAQITVEMWAYWNAISDQWIIDKRVAPTNENYGYLLRSDTPSDTIRWRAGNGSTYAQVTGAITTGKWYHIAGTYNGTNIELFINGGSQGQAGLSAIDYTGVGDLYIGCASDFSRDFSGKIDDVRIYSYARTQAQIAEDYTAGAARLGAQVSGEADPWGGALPVAYWKMDENTGVLARDASGNGNDGTLVGDPTWTQGKLGPCLNFDGSGDAVKALSLSPSIAGTDSYSVSLWAKRSGLTGTYTFMWEGQTNSRPSLESSGNSTSYLFYVNGNSSISTGPLADDVWYHIVAVYDKAAQEQKLFVNSVSKGTNSIDASDSMTSFYIGSRGGTGLWFNGLLDDVRVYKYALTQAQVAWLYNKGKPVGHWRFNESSGTDAWDDSGNNNGTITIGGTGSQTTIAQARTNGATGKFGRCLSLDGTNDYVACGNDASLVMGTGDFTIEAWINSDVLYGPSWDDPVGCIVQTRDLNSGSVQDGYYLGIGVSTIFFQIGDGSVNNGDFRITYTDIGNWHHVVATRDAGSLFKLYLDGEFKGQDSDPCGDVGNTQNFHIGSRNAGSHFWDGLIDDVRVYNYVRTTAQIKEDYNNGLAARLGD